MAYPPLPEDEKLSLPSRVYQALKQGILSFELKPKEYLITGEVAKAYGISRTPVREALILLEKEGWVKLQGIRGAMVAWPSRKTISEAIQVKMVLEGFVVKEAIRTLGDTDIQELEKILAESEAALEAGDVQGSESIGSRFHTFLQEKAGNRVLQAIFEQLQDQIDRVRPLIWRRNREMIEESARQHRAMLAAIKDRDPEKAEQLVYQHAVWFEEQVIPSMIPILD